MPDEQGPSPASGVLPVLPPDPDPKADLLRRARVLLVLLLVLTGLLIVRGVQLRRAVGPPPLLVEVDGEVPRPGLYAFANGGTIADALEKSGFKADPSVAMMDRPLADGLRIIWDGEAVILALAQDRLLVGLPLDINTASALELELLPGVGPATAAAIVADRETQGPFGSIEDLERVPRIGEATIRRIAPYLEAGGALAGPDEAPVEEAQEPVQEQPPSADGPPEGPLDPNAATLEQWLALPGIGPTKAAAIVTDRQAKGPFAGCDDLVRVKGIGPATVVHLRPFLRCDKPATGAETR